jgi:hypothetical protein
VHIVNVNYNLPGVRGHFLIGFAGILGGDIIYALTCIMFTCILEYVIFVYPGMHGNKNMHTAQTFPGMS